MEVDQSKVIKVTNNRYRLNYHIAAPSGWINDPNGFIYFKGYYHIFYQYYPYDSQWGPMHWGHKRSKDLVHWEQLPVALVPGDSEDKDGCFSGSAIVRNNRLYLIYTGHNLYDKNDPDRFWQNQNLAYSDDGVHFTKYEDNPIIAEPPKDSTANFRDPKVWEYDGKYYLIVGGETENHLGHALLYRSTDLKKWDFLGEIGKAEGNEGQIWECPDLFRVNGSDILLISPQGIKTEAKKYMNFRQTGYFVGQMNYEQNSYSYEHAAFKEMDKGHDIYATQTTLTPDGRRILLAWMDMWNAEMPEQKDGWAGSLIFPRELTVKNNHLYMKPVKELNLLHDEKEIDQTESYTQKELKIKDSQHCEINLNYNLNEFIGQKFAIHFNDSHKDMLSLTYNKKKHEFILYRNGKDPYRYGSIKGSQQIKIQILIDTSSAEFFINDGELVFTERYYADQKPTVVLDADSLISTNITVYSLKK